MKAWLARSAWVAVAAVVLLVGLSGVVVAAAVESTPAGCDVPDASEQPVYPLCCFAAGGPLSNCVLTGTRAGAVLPSGRAFPNSDSSLRDSSTTPISQTVPGLAKPVEWLSLGGAATFLDTGYRCRNSLGADEPPFCLTTR